MNTRTTEVCWDPTLVRMEYLDEAGIPYYCCFNARDQPPASGTSQGPGDQANPRWPEQAETAVGGLVVVVITMVMNDGGGGNGRGPPAGPGPSAVKRTATRRYRSGR